MVPLLGSEIFRRFDKPHSENLLPESVHSDAGCEWVRRVDKPPRQCQSIQAIFRGVLSCVGKELREP